ncbi:YdeI/OmpD-associated family protein, partial [Pseudopedobacter sp.]|uniref:YdeI/OmpD-associated family protein n=1 Tax=Pseudopedobacter sp. TaxID=1936787 RepID=UPI00334215B2
MHLDEKLFSFEAEIEIIGINPYVQVPNNILEQIFVLAEKDKGFIPVKGTVNESPYQQTLVKYRGLWRLYINTTMLKDSPKRIGEKIHITLSLDLSDRTILPHPRLLEALEENKAAREVFDRISPSLRKEIIRYISFLKTEESITKNVNKAIDFLLGKGRFVGRDRP